MNIFAAYELQAALQQTSRLANQPIRAGRIATVELVGVMNRAGEFGTSTDATARYISALAADTEVSCIVLFVSSPGGTVAGTMELADAVAAAAKVKPVLAFIQDMGASAAFWAVSGASKIFAEPMALIGGIGTYGVIYDMSGAAAMQGIRVHVVKAGAYKGAGVPGTSISDGHLVEAQRIIDAQNAHFLAGVSRGRKMKLERVRELADGRVHVGQEAVKLGLIDGVLSYSSFQEQLRQQFAATKHQSKGTYSMFEVERRPGPACESFWSEVESRIQRGEKRERAISAVVAAEPGLHQQMLAETNAAR